MRARGLSHCPWPILQTPRIPRAAWCRPSSCLAPLARPVPRPPGHAMPAARPRRRRERAVQARVVGAWAPERREPQWATELAARLADLVALYGRRLAAEKYAARPRSAALCSAQRSVPRAGAGRDPGCGHAAPVPAPSFLPATSHRGASMTLRSGQEGMVEGPSPLLQLWPSLPPLSTPEFSRAPQDRGSKWPNLPLG
jgi:hypothetical protein